jgi:hypothetical protein
VGRMPVHDWTRVDAGIFHSFHLLWIGELQGVLNDGLLPPGYYALGEQVLGGLNPDVLTLHEPLETGNGTAVPPGSHSGGVALATCPPQVQVRQQSGLESYSTKQRELVIRHTSNHAVIAIVEIVAPGNKASDYPFRQFVDKTLAALARGIHVLVLDLFPPTPRDPQGVHSALWGELNGETYLPPVNAPLTLAAYAARVPKEAFVEPFAPGTPLADMPLFFDPERYIPLPLEATYQAAYRRMPAFYRQILER